MPFPPDTLLYPFDPTGTVVGNKIAGEQQIITGANFRDYHFIVPEMAPYFQESLVVKFRDTNNVVTTLTEGIDYYCTHEFIAASRACAKPIFGSISFLNTLLTGVIILDYQTLGGIWNQDEAAIATILADRLSNPRTTSWDVVVDMPVSFPVIDHEWDLADMVGLVELVAAVAGIEDALRQTGQTGITDHIANLGNPHQVNKAQVGLGSVRNLPTATVPEAIAGTSDDLYTTPLSTFKAIEAQALIPLTTHINNSGNPHLTTASQVGAYSKLETDALLDAIRNSGLSANDTLHFGQMDPDEYRAWVLAETSSNALKFDGYTFGDAFTYFRQAIPAGNILGAYSASEVDDLLITKLDVGGTAVDSTKFGGLNTDDYKTFVLEGKSADTFKMAGKDLNELTVYFSDAISGTGSTKQARYAAEVHDPATLKVWTRLGIIKQLVSTEVPTGDLQLLVAGGDSSLAYGSSLYAVRGYTRDATADGARIEVTNLLGVPTTARFGIVVTQVSSGGEMVDEGVIWMETDSSPTEVTITRLAKGDGDIVAINERVLVEPPTITYVTESVFAKPSDIATALTDYVDTTELATALDDYATTTDVEGAIDTLTAAFIALRDSITG